MLVSPGDEDNNTLELENIEQKRLKIYHYNSHYKDKDYLWVYLGRNNHTVNLEAFQIPYCIRRLAYFYSISGRDLDVLDKALQAAKDDLAEKKKQFEQVNENFEN